MDKKTIIDIDAKIVDNNQAELSQVGSTFCGNYHKVSKELCDKNFAAKSIEAKGTGALWLNQGVQRVKVTGVPVLKIEYGQVSDGEHVKPVVYINRDMVKTVGNQSFDQSMTLPVGNGTSVYSDANVDEAFKEALNGEKRIFANPADVISRANILNEAALAEVRALKKYLSEQENLLVNTINSNNTLGKRYMEVQSKIVTPASTTVVVEEN